MPQLKPPAYNVGDQVAVLIEDEETLFDIGIVMGFDLNPRTWALKGYVYSIEFTHGPSKGYRDWAHESELVSLRWLCGPIPVQLKCQQTNSLLTA